MASKGSNHEEMAEITVERRVPWAPARRRVDVVSAIVAPILYTTSRVPGTSSRLSHPFTESSEKEDRTEIGARRPHTERVSDPLTRACSLEVHSNGVMPPAGRSFNLASHDGLIWVAAQLQQKGGPMSAHSSGGHPGQVIVSPQAFQGKTLRVLLINDDAASLTGLRDDLEAAGADVVASTTDGEEGLELARLLRPDVALIKWSMQHFGGALTALLLRRYAPEVCPVLLVERTDMEEMFEIELDETSDIEQTNLPSFGDGSRASHSDARRRTSG